MLVPTKDFLTQSLDFDFGGSFPAGSFQYGLFQNAVVLDEDTVLADLTPCTFSGYTGLQTPVWGSASWDGSGLRAVVDGSTLTWIHDGGPTANDVHGYYVVDGAGTTLLWAENRPAGPVTLLAAGDAFIVATRYTRRKQS